MLSSLKLLKIAAWTFQYLFSAVWCTGCMLKLKITFSVINAGFLMTLHNSFKRMIFYLKLLIFLENKTLRLKITCLFPFVIIYIQYKAYRVVVDAGSPHVPVSCQLVGHDAVMAAVTAAVVVVVLTWTNNNSNEQVRQFCMNNFGVMFY